MRGKRSIIALSCALTTAFGAAYRGSAWAWRLAAAANDASNQHGRHIRDDWARRETIAFPAVAEQLSSTSARIMLHMDRRGI
jgi:hypothetical protein